MVVAGTLVGAADKAAITVVGLVFEDGASAAAPHFLPNTDHPPIRLPKPVLVLAVVVGKLFLPPELLTTPPCLPAMIPLRYVALVLRVEVPAPSPDPLCS
jgi:hypothetical protein